MIIITLQLFLFYIIMSFILGLTIMALSYELYLYCKKKRKIIPINTVYIANPIKYNDTI